MPRQFTDYELREMFNAILASDDGEAIHALEHFLSIVHRQLLTPPSFVKGEIAEGS